MAEYSIGFSEELVEAARYLADQRDKSDDTTRAILYLSLLACEIALKALLESSGQSVEDITRLGHDFSELLRALDSCRVQDRIAEDRTMMPAARLRAVMVNEHFDNATVGTILTAVKNGASKYPNEIRYGKDTMHYPSKIVLETAVRVTKWAREHQGDIHNKQ